MHSPSAVARLFFGLWPDPPVRHELLALQQRWQWPRGARVTAPEKLHATLHFVGNVERERIAGLTDAMRSVRFERLVMPWESAQVWPGGIAVLEMAVTPSLQTLHEAVAIRLLEQGLTPEARRYRPHVTLARHAKGVVSAPDLPGMAWEADAFVLVESRGGRYEVLERFQAIRNADE
ncbi:MAG TPA: RNA 2',3'-cyclic phosphodiesterase [Burkholderiaceae bacterium]|nr:RNA 2',3'-cyclic phosphodiesterase [Burkholderiaceae bacterium]